MSSDGNLKLDGHGLSYLGLYDLLPVNNDLDQAIKTSSSKVADLTRRLNTSDLVHQNEIVESRHRVVAIANNLRFIRLILNRCYSLQQFVVSCDKTSPNIFDDFDGSSDYRALQSQYLDYGKFIAIDSFSLHFLFKSVVDELSALAVLKPIENSDLEAIPGLLFSEKFVDLPILLQRELRWLYSEIQIPCYLAPILSWQIVQSGFNTSFEVVTPIGIHVSAHSENLFSCDVVSFGNKRSFLKSFETSQSIEDALKSLQLIRTFGCCSANVYEIAHRLTCLISNILGVDDILEPLS
jgi:hypothetical protein